MHSHLIDLNLSIEARQGSILSLAAASETWSQTALERLVSGELVAGLVIGAVVSAALIGSSFLRNSLLVAGAIAALAVYVHGGIPRLLFFASEIRFLFLTEVQLYRAFFEGVLLGTSLSAFLRIWLRSRRRS